MSACGVEHCKQQRVPGTPYCHNHMTIESRTGHGVSAGVLASVLALSLLALWCLNNAATLNGRDCKQMLFEWGTVFTSPFVCDTAEGPLAPTGISWLAAPAGMPLANVLTVVGWTLLAGAAVLVYSALRGARRAK